MVSRERVGSGGRKGWQDVRVVRFGGQLIQTRRGAQRVVVCDPLFLLVLWHQLYLRVDPSRHASLAYPHCTALFSTMGDGRWAMGDGSIVCCSLPGVWPFLPDSQRATLHIRPGAEEWVTSGF